jgi:hypothetical protein
VFTVGRVARYSDRLRAGRWGDRIPVGARFSALVQTESGAHPASCIMGTGSFPAVKSGRGVTLTPYPFLVPWSWQSRAIPLLPLWAVRLYRALVPVQGCILPFFLLPCVHYRVHKILKQSWSSSKPHTISQTQINIILTFTSTSSKVLSSDFRPKFRMHSSPLPYELYASLVSSSFIWSLIIFP